MCYKPKHMRIKHPNSTENFSIDILEKDIDNFDKYYFNNDRNYDVMLNEYLSVCNFWEDCFIQSDYICITGNFETAQRVLIGSFKSNIKAHPILWRLFRMIFAV